MSNLQGFEKAIKTVRQLDEELPLQRLHFLMVVHREEANGGCDYTTLEKELNTTKAAISRMAQDLGFGRNDRGAWREGKGWVEVRRDPYNPRTVTVHLAKKGKSLCDELAKFVNP